MKVLVEEGIDRGTVFRLHDGMNTLGRDVGNKIMLADPKISRHHCTLRKVGQSLYLSDLDTRNGTSVNGKPVSGREIVAGDCIIVGNTTLRILDGEPAAKGDFGQPESAGAKPAFSFTRVISDKIFGRGSARGPKTRSNTSYKFLPRGPKAIWKTRSLFDHPKKKSKSIATTEPD